MGLHARVVARALEVLAQVGAPVVGTVLNNVSTNDTYGDDYKYRYYQPGPRGIHINGSTAATNGEPRPVQSWDR